jgi:hypothetical protein
MPVAYSASATLNARVQATHVRTDELGTARESVDLNYASQLSSGHIDLVYRDTLDIEPSNEPTVYLDGPIGVAFTDCFGQDRDFSTVVSMMIKNLSNTPGDVLTVGSSTFAALPAGMEIPPGGVLFLVSPVDGWEVADGDNFTLANDTENTISVDIVITGIAA